MTIDDEIPKGKDDSACGLSEVFCLENRPTSSGRYYFQGRPAPFSFNPFYSWPRMKTVLFFAFILSFVELEKRPQFWDVLP
jgi:hypothetical protein